MTETLERLKLKRQPIRDAVKRIVEKLDTEIKRSEKDEDMLTELLHQLTIKADSLKELNEKVQETTNLKELPKEIDESLALDEQIELFKYRTEKEVKKLQLTDNLDSNQAQSTTQCTVKLPSLTICKFDGDPLIWQSFWDQFDSAINQNTTLSEVDKFNYLKSYLTGNAAEAVCGFSLTNRNYDLAVSVLTERFGRKDLVVNACMNKLLNIQSVKRCADVEGLRRMYDQIEINVRSLTALQIGYESYGALLCPMLLKLLPEELALEFSRQNARNETWNVRTILDFLKLEVESRERAACILGSNSKYKTPEKPNPPFQIFPKEKFSSASALTANVHNRCMYCDKTDHSPERCTCLTVKEKKDRLRKQGRCFICLGLKHLARYCRKRSEQCSKCSKRHHISICDAELKINEEATQPTVLSTLLPDSDVKRAKQSVLLQTADTLLTNGRKQFMVKCLFDGGSQRTFIKEEISKAMSLPVVGEEILSIYTFGSSNPVKARLRKVKLVLRSLNVPSKEIQIDALESSELCNSIMSVPGEEVKKIMERKNLPLADKGNVDNGTDQHVSILIGADNYWKVVSGRVERIKGALVATETLFGWCVQGPTDYTDDGCFSVMKTIVEQVGQDLVSKQLRTCWEIESLGIRDEPATTTNSETDMLKEFETSTKFVDGRHEIALPWKRSKNTPGNNFETAKQRLNGPIKKFKADPSFYDRYQQIISEQLRDGTVKRVESHYTEQLMDQWWKRWKAEYLIELRSAYMAHPQASHNVKPGDVILVKDDQRPRHMWKLEKKNVFPGRDGKVRSVAMKTGTGVEIKRPMQFVCSLGIDQT